MKIAKLKWKFDSGVNGRRILRAIERAGRKCYKSEAKITDDSAPAFVAKIIKSDHHSVLEHQSITIDVTCNRGLSHETVRHRIAAYSQESTRYCNYSKGRFGEQITLIPMLVGLSHAQVERRLDLYRLIEHVYQAELREGVKPQQARDNLPICLKTEIMITYNLRQWRHFFGMRTTFAAHPQMRELVRPMLARFRRKVPVVFDDVGVVSEKD